MDTTVRFKLNGENAEIASEQGQTLLWVLRNHFGLTGTKFGCGIGFCGAHVRMIQAIETAATNMKGGK